MMSFKKSLFISLFSLLTLSVQAWAQDATTERIIKASHQNGPNIDWPSFGGDYTNQRFSHDSQITKDNVKNLSLAWQYDSGVKASFQATPIVVDGIMYISLPFNHVVALNAKTGDILWKYEHDRRTDWDMCCGPANRGVAVGYGKVFIGTVDARIIALDAKTGQKLWDINAVDEKVKTEIQQSLNQADPNSKAKTTGGTGVGLAMAPIVYQGKLIIGITGVGYGLHIDNPREDAPLGAVIGLTGRYGRPGFLAAFDVETGKRIWQFDTIPPEGWEGQFKNSTEDGISFNRNIAAEKAALPLFKDSAQFGGGSAWSTPAIDPKLGLLYFGTGNPSPQMNDVSRPGDNLYTVSLIALDVNTGKLRWYYQQVPHDVWGYDLASPPILFNYHQGNKVIPAVGQASKLGWFFVNNRATGELILKSDPFVPQRNLFAKASFEGVTLYPGILGGSNWSPASIDENKQLAFVAAIHAPIRYTLHETSASEGREALRYTSSEPADEARWGVLSAINLKNGKVIWQNKTAQPLVGGVLATEGGIVFTGEGNGHFNAYNETTGELLWEAKTDAGVNAPPITYEIDGEQYIAVAAGGNSIFGFKPGDHVLVFKLKSK
jgi:glucose dehydrogenase